MNDNTPPQAAQAEKRDSDFRGIKIVAIIIACVVVLFIGSVWVIRSSSSPRALLRRLADAEGEDRERITIELNLARGDVVGPMIEAFQDSESSGAFRADLLELLFKRYARSKEERIKTLLDGSLTDSDAAVVRKSVYCYTVYVGNDEQLPLVDLATHPDPEVRKQVYLLLCAQGNWRRGGGVWHSLSQEDEGARRDKLVEDILVQSERETDPEMQYLTRSVLGRRIEELTQEATQSLQRSDRVRAEELMAQAERLDPENHQLRIRAARLLLAAGETKAAIALAEKHGALMRIPLLDAAPVMDGDPTEDAWKKALTDDRFYLSNSRWSAKRATGKTELRVGHRDGVVFIAILAYEDDLDALVVKHSVRDSDVWRDDCVELFFDPANAEKLAFQFVINAKGAYFDSYDRKKTENIESEHGTGIYKDRGYWCCEFAVAASAMKGATITADSIWGMNIMRTRIGAAAEQQAWWPTFGHSLNYHLHPLAVFEGVSRTPDAGEGDASDKEAPVPVEAQGTF